MAAGKIVDAQAPEASGRQMTSGDSRRRRARAAALARDRERREIALGVDDRLAQAGAEIGRRGRGRG